MSIYHKLRPLAALSVALMAGTPPAAAQSADTQAASAGFETFTVPSTEDAPKTGASAHLLVSSPTPGPLPPKNRLDALVGLTLFPGGSDLSLDLSGQINGQAIASQTSAKRWLSGDWTNAGFLQVARGGDGLRLGQSSSDLMGSAEGVRLSSAPTTSRQPTLGLGFYQRLGDSQAGGTLAADSQWRLDGHDSLGLLLAADSSWRAVQQSDGRNWQVSSFLGRDAHASRLEGGLLLSVRPARSASVYGRVSGWSGAQAGQNWSLGTNCWVGPAFLAMDYSHFRSVGSATQQTSTSVFLPMRRGTVSLRWQNGRDDSSDGPGTERQFTRSLLASLSLTPDARTGFWADGGPAWQGNGGRPEVYLSLGVRRSFGQFWEAEAEGSQRLESTQRQLRLALGYRIGGADEIKLLFGPTSGFDADGAQRHALGLEVVHDFRYRSEASGAVGGQVLLGGRPGGAGRLIRLDGGLTARTDRAGRFQIGHVPPGPHAVGMDMADLPADLSPDVTSPVVIVEVGKTSLVNLNLRRVGQVRGVVRVAPDAFGQTDCTAGIGITIAAGDVQTTTDGGAAFVLGGLAPGRCRLSLAKETIPPDFDVIGPDAIDVDVTPDGPIPDVQFAIAPHQATVAFSNGPAADSPSAAFPRPPAASPRAVPPVDVPAPGSAARTFVAATPRLHPAPMPVSPVPPRRVPWPRGMLSKGTVAPDFSLQTPDGKLLSLAALRGRVVVLNFWSSWCGSPQQGLPPLQALQKQFGAQALAVVSVNSWDNQAAMTAFLDAHHLSRDGQVCDSTVSNDSVAVRLYKVPGVPALYVLDQTGKVQAAYVGYGRATMDALKATVSAVGVSQQAHAPTPSLLPR